MKKIFSRIIFITFLIIIVVCFKVNASTIFSNEGMEGFINKNIELMIFLTLLTVLPMLIIMTTSFTRIVVTFAFLKNASGLQNAVPSVVLIGLSIMLTFFIMFPVGQRINNEAIVPYINKEISTKEAYDKGVIPLKEFMFTQTRKDDLDLFIELSKYEGEVTAIAVPMTTLMPAFALSEIKTSFQIGFLIFIPFLVIDMVIASILMAMGMMMVSPAIISLPFKILLIVLVDGWKLVIKSIFLSFGGV
ncbi:flagellar type III secretion system pore protein FliP [Candidatus Arthromitus sp. SFB-turkey]|uniref:flagellar type III secretion system pore protein FliP n=1 Tax=Candidatus Arthromitus sp. SFB-turkey TaxID=1840217 RepID=UPI0007F463F7|nr:flagellar type III secretion system pore protein FliP [Candidatus Arthromitus sp. SFB-turkey]OAT88964.1 flagellar biosynthesis protein flip [Candidatus Arthromitus sp. SFB-turkey]